MSKYRAMYLAATIISGLLSNAGTASALPISGHWMKNAAPTVVETVRARGGFRGGGWRRGGWGVGGGFASGAILGGLFAAPYYYPGPGYYYYGPGPGDPIAYCMSRFKSYDPSSGTYRGYDGHRHACP